ncbi:MAG: cbb3-type cytochrome c oxidase subunit I [Halobacteriales archaeon]|nr:cbb3-type cytochrome c oxidase subunit I [Halobacteriales archaeon]
MAHAEESNDHEGHMPPKSTIKRWLVTTNHKDVGILYFMTSIFYLIFGGVLALLIRVQLLEPGASPLSGAAYNQVVTGHGLVMIFFFISPFAFAFANYFVPLQIGAKDLAFPRLNAFSFWSYFFGGLLFGLSFFLGGGSFSGGWTMYAPLNAPAYMPAVGSTAAVLGVTLFVISTTISSVNFLTTIHSMRAEGMRIRDMPIFSWSILLTVWMMLIAFAALLAALIIMVADHVLGTTYFTTSIEGSGSFLWMHLFWFFGHPEVYIVLFPALGALGEILKTFTGNRLAGRKWIMIALALVAIQSFIVWMHHMFLTGLNFQTKTLFMATTIAISLPFDLMVFGFIYTMIKGKVRLATPMLYALATIVLFIIGGITGVFLGAIPLDYNLRGGYWVVAHFHYVMFGGAAALVGAVFYWFPKMSGKMYNETLGKLQFAVFFLGFNLLYFPLFFAYEMPRRVFVYDISIKMYQNIATVGGFILGLSILMIVGIMLHALKYGEPAGDNPWKGWTSEWTVSSPPPLENFSGTPSFKSGKLDMLNPATDGSGTGTAETDGGHAVAEEEHADHASLTPFLIAMTTFVMFLGLSGFSQSMAYAAVAGLGGAGMIATLIWFGFEGFKAPAPTNVEKWPFEGVEQSKLGVWIFLLSDIVVFGAFIGASVFMRFAYGWQDWHHDLIPADHVVLPGLINTYLLLTSSFAVVLALVAIEKKSKKGLVASLVATLVLGLGFLVNKGVEWDHLFHISTEAFPSGWGFNTNIASSTFYLTTGMHGLHVTLGLLILVFLIYRAWFNDAYMNDDRPVEYFGLYWHFVDIVWLFLFPLFYII